MIAAILAFTVMVSLIKVARQDLSAFEVIFWRGLVSVPVTLALARGRVRVGQKGRLWARLLFGFAAMVCYYGAAKALAVGDLQVIWRIQPIVIAFVAPLLLGAVERPERGLWAVLLVGLGGCALVIGPDLAVGSWWGAVALGAVGFSALSHTALRSLKDEHSAAVAFWFQLFATMVGGLIALGVTGLRPPEGEQWLVLPAIGVLSALGQWLMTLAYAREKAAPVAAAAYIAPVFGFLIDFFAFGVPPRVQALVGGAIVVGAGLFLVFRPQAASS